MKVMGTRPAFQNVSGLGDYPKFVACCSKCCSRAFHVPHEALEGLQITEHVEVSVSDTRHAVLGSLVRREAVDVRVRHRPHHVGDGRRQRPQGR